MKVTLIISTYNRPDALSLCLLSAFRQDLLPDEIIIGDDGSSSETKQIIDNMRKRCPVKLIHIWHEDLGFRLAMMRNKCIALASSEYIIEIDGDIIMHRYFIRDHVRYAEKGFYLKGGRANLNQKFTEKICRNGKLPTLGLFSNAYESKRENSLNIPFIGRLLLSRYRVNRGLSLGCNMSFFRSDAIAINGYDEFFEGWGGEDGDFARRLRLLGIRKHHLKFIGNTFHLWHEDKFMYNKSINIEYSMRDISDPVCENGINKYMSQITALPPDQLYYSF